MAKIEWTGRTWNPIVGCSVVSPGCANCYAMRMAARLGRMGQERYAGLTKPSKAGPVWTGEMRFVESALTLPIRTRKPTTWFVNSMSDLFHEGATDEWIDRIFAVIALAGHQTFQVLTKRSARMRAYVSDVFTPERIWAEFRAISAEFPDQLADLLGYNHTFARAAHDTMARVLMEGQDPKPILGRKALGWPLPNVWLGVSAEDQRRADERVPDLLATPAAIRFVSAEPLLGPINFRNVPYPSPPEDAGRRGSALHGHEVAGMVGNCIDWIPPLDWIIVGGESGPCARGLDVEWARSIVRDCEGAGVACFVKQLGANVTGPHPNGVNVTTLRLNNRKGGDPAEWPADLRVREMPGARA